jgi:hypothetical protein
MVLSLNLLEEVPEARALLMHGGAGYMANHGARRSSLFSSGAVTVVNS